MLNRRNVTYLYDGSFDGLLTAIFECYENKEIPLSITENNSVQQELFSDYKIIETDTKKSERVFDTVRNKISPSSLIYIYYTYLSDTPEREMLCFEYVSEGLKRGNKINHYLNIDCVNNVINSVRRIKNEAEQYRGFVRFSELENGVFYSCIEPKCNIMPLIANHFIKRFSSLPWIIHDISRELCMVYNGKICYFETAYSMPKIVYSEDEKQYRDLWKNFYEKTEIKERHNERCRMSHMPKRMWKYLTEFEVNQNYKSDNISDNTKYNKQCYLDV